MEEIEVVVDGELANLSKSSIHEETLMEEIEAVEDVELANLSKSMLLKLDKLAANQNEKFSSMIDSVFGQPVTIFPVPSEFRQGKENLFDPSSFSIGPLHHGKEILKAKEDDKWSSLQNFLSRGDHINLNLCLSEIKKLEEKTRRCYGENVPLDSNSFVEMMLLDGCFVFEFFLSTYKWMLDFSNFSIGFFESISSDLLLLENQIPFFIVEKLCEIGIKAEDIMHVTRSYTFNVFVQYGFPDDFKIPDRRRDFRNFLVSGFARAGPAEDRMDFRNCLVKFFARAGPADLDDSIIPNPQSEIHHFVDLCYQCSIPNDQNEPAASNMSPSILTIIKYWLLEFFLRVLTRIFPKSNSLCLFSPNYTRKRFMLIPCATELQNAGIKLRPKSKPYCMLDISFDDHVLEIPTVTITSQSKTLFANLIAFEQCQLDEMRAKFSGYALFLHSLVNTPEDVKILQKCGIVNNGLDSEEELNNFFNQIREGMDVKEDHFFWDLFRDVNKYCESSRAKRRARRNRHKTQFIRTYFSSPWTAISLVGAVLVVLFTFVQTVFAVLAYFVPRS